MGLLDLEIWEMSYSWAPVKEYMLKQSVRWYDVDGQIIFPNYDSGFLTLKGVSYVIEIDDINEKFFCLGMTISPIWEWKKVVDLIVDEFLNNKYQYELPWSTLDGQPLPKPVEMIWDTELELPRIKR